MSRVLDKMAKTAHTWNGALSYSTTGTGLHGALLDYWAKAGTYQGRPQASVDQDMVRIFSDDEKLALAALFGLRLITRTPDVNGIEEAQTGHGRKDEFFKGFRWLFLNRRQLAVRNLHLVPVFGCWKDFLQEPLLSLGEEFHTQFVYPLIKENLGDPLLLKYLPQIYSPGKKSRKTHKRTGRKTEVIRCHTPRARVLRDWALGLIKFLGITRSDYRRMKSNGTAHIWQQQMSEGEWDSIDFKTIPGRAMLHLTSRKGKHDKKTAFERHGQIVRLKEWVESQPLIKFTGYPYELLQAASIKKNPTTLQKLIYDRQFLSLLEPMKGHGLGNVLCALDTSGSMTIQVTPNATAYDICVSMGLAFSSLNVGHFKDAVVAFSDSSTLVTLKGGFCDRLHQIQAQPWWMGSTNFQSVINLLVNIRKTSPEIPLDEYPETLLVISDMQFNPVGRNTKTNYEAAMRKLHSVGLGDMRIIWWYVNGSAKDFPCQMGDKGMYIISGFDPNNLKALMGLSKAPEGKKDFVAAEKKEETPLDGMMNFLSQPIFGLLQL